MKNVKDFFNDNTKEWSEEVLEEKRQYKIVEKFYNCYSMAKTNKPKILDIGCGLGYEVKLLAELGAIPSGVDFSEKTVKLARKNVPGTDFFTCDVSDSLGQIGQFDGVLCLETLDYIENSKMKDAFENISSVLKSGGLLLVSVLNGNDKNNERSFVKLNGEDYDKNFYCYNAEQLCTYAWPDLKLVDTWQFNDFDEGWRYYVFMKQSIKK